MPYRISCAVYDQDNWRSYTKPCPPVYKSDPLDARSWTSSEMLGMYDAVCPYFDRY